VVDSLQAEVGGNTGEIGNPCSTFVHVHQLVKILAFPLEKQGGKRGKAGGERETSVTGNLIVYKCHRSHLNHSMKNKYGIFHPQSELQRAAQLHA
jgi:hypothetical protein